MTQVSVADFKARFSDILESVRRGERVAIQYGRRKKIVAILIPPQDERNKPDRKLGILEGKATFTVKRDWKMTPEDLCLGE